MQENRQTDLQEENASLRAKIADLQKELKEANGQWHMLSKRDAAFQTLLNDIYQLEVNIQECNERKHSIYVFSQNGREIGRNASIVEGYRHTLALIRRKIS